jgi:hypothetical protein
MSPIDQGSFGEPCGVAEISGADPDERHLGPVGPVTVELRRPDGLGGQNRILPRTPRLDRGIANGRIRAFHHLGVPPDNAAGGIDPGCLTESVPCLGEEPADAAVQPVDLGPSRGGHRGQHQRGDVFGVLLGVGQGQG